MPIADIVNATTTAADAAAIINEIKALAETHATSKVTKTGDTGLGALTIGLAAAQTITGAAPARVQIAGNYTADASLLLAKYTNNSNRPQLVAYRSAGSGPGVNGALSSGALFGVEAYGDGGSGPVRGAGIYPTISGTVTAAYVPTHIAFFNTDGAGAYGERFRIKADGGLQAGSVLGDILSAERHFVARIYTRATLPTPTATNVGQARVSNPESGKTALVYCNGTAWVYEGDGSAVTIA